METNKRLLKTVIFSIGILVAGSLIFINYLKLEEPVFFDHYYDLAVYEDQRPYDQFFTLGYITNVQDTRTVVNIEFPEQPNMRIQASEDAYASSFVWDNERSRIPGEVYGRYSVRSVFCNIVSLPDAYSESTLTKVQVTFSDGSEKMVDIGQIHIYKHDPNRSFLDSLSSSSSSDGSSKTSYRVIEDIQLLRIESPLLDKVSQKVEIEINNKDRRAIEGISVAQNEALNLSAQIVPADDIIQRYTKFDIHPKLVFKIEDGSEHFIRFYNISSMHPNYRFIDLYQYLRAKGAI